jgi:hypothetical protein
LTGDDVRNARLAIGQAMGLGRPLRLVELGELLRLEGRDVGASVWEWERDHTPVKGPTSLAIEAMVDGWRPSGWRDCIRWPAISTKDGKRKRMTGTQ